MTRTPCLTHARTQFWVLIRTPIHLRSSTHELAPLIQFRTHAHALATPFRPLRNMPTLGTCSRRHTQFPTRCTRTHAHTCTHISGISRMPYTNSTIATKRSQRHTLTPYTYHPLSKRTHRHTQKHRHRHTHTHLDCRREGLPGRLRMMIMSP